LMLRGRNLVTASAACRGAGDGKAAKRRRLSKIDQTGKIFFASLGESIFLWDVIEFVLLVIFCPE
jgi:hypothetical protein